MTMVSVDVTCRGITPILFNRMDEDVLIGISTGVKPPRTRERPSPRQQCEKKVYVTADGKPYLPTENLLACLIAAGQYVRLDGKRQMSTAKSTLLPAFMTICDPYLPLHVPGTKRAPAWEVDIRQGKNPNGGEAVCLCRPRFDQWSFTASLLIDTSEIGENAIRDLWDKAGKRIGLGDFRPARKGMFGQFVIECWEKKKISTVTAAE